MESDERLNYLENEIERRKRLPVTVKKNIGNIVFQNLITAAILTGYFCVIDFMFFKMNQEQFESFLKYFSLIMIAVTIATFEIAYRNDSKKFLSFGVEFLISSILSLYIPFIYYHTDVRTRFIVMIIPAILVVYYLIKSLWIITRKKFRYQSTNISDVREMMHYSERKGYLDEESTKSYGAKRAEESKIRRAISEEQKLRHSRRRRLEKR